MKKIKKIMSCAYCGADIPWSVNNIFGYGNHKSHDCPQLKGWDVPKKKVKKAKKDE